MTKVYKKVFDNNTLDNLYYLMRKGIIEQLNFPISEGKEAIVFRAEKGKNISDDFKYLAVKIYKIKTSTFKNMLYYIEGDIRFEDIKKDKRNIVYKWVSKEYKNIMRVYKAKVNVPKPITFKGNVLVMEFLGKEIAYPLLKYASDHLSIKQLEHVFYLILDEIDKIRKAKLVHADLSEYNILLSDDLVPYIIDWGQAMVLDNIKAYNLFNRDLNNIINFFKKKGVNFDENKIFKRYSI